MSHVKVFQFLEDFSAQDTPSYAVMSHKYESLKEPEFFHV